MKLKQHQNLNDFKNNYDFYCQHSRFKIKIEKDESICQCCSEVHREK